jgi:rubredoxin
VFRWLTRLFSKHAAAEGRSEDPSAVPSLFPLAHVAPEEIVSVAPESTLETITPTALVEEIPEKDTCPDCGKTSVFAGPPEHRYCMHCALRQELFDANAAASP